MSLTVLKIVSTTLRDSIVNDGMMHPSGQSLCTSVTVYYCVLLHAVSCLCNAVSYLYLL